MSDDEVYMVALAPESVKSVERPKSPRLQADTVVSNRLAELKKQRATVKGRLTLFEKYISGFQKENIDFNPNIVVEIDLRIQSQSVIFQNFNDIQGEIEQMTFESDLPTQLEYRESFESKYFSLMASAKCMLNGINSEQKQTLFQSSVGRPVSIKLPEIKLPSFDGSYDQWLEYRNSYLTMIHNRQDLNEIQKFHYLKSSLSGTASQVIGALEFTAPNYAHAWDLLEIRFHNNRLLVQNHVKSLFATPSLHSESPAHIRKLIDSTLRNLRALKSLNEPTDSWDTLIVYLIVSKLDPSTEREWESHKGLLTSTKGEFETDTRNNIKLDDLLNFLRNRADMLEMIKSSSNKTTSAVKQSHESNRTNSNQNTNKKHSNSSSNPQPHTHSYLSQKANYDKTKQKRVCVLCSEDHFLYSCAKFLNMSVKDRFNIVKEKNLCQNCIRSEHSSNECSFGPCKLCQARHNTLLHNNYRSSVGLGTVASTHSSLPTSNSLQKSADAQAQVGSEQRVLTCHTAVQPVLLSTALIDVPDSNNRYHTVRALLDNGSQNCFITESLVNRLRLPIIQSTIRISGVGQTVSQCTHACNLNIRSKVSDFNTEIQCLILPIITSNLPSINVNCESIDIPTHIALADPTFSVSSEIDILLGADIFWDLLKGTKIRLSTGPYLHDSEIGWIISGPIRNKYSYNIDRVQCNFVQIDSQLRRFWELEELRDVPTSISKDDRYCETFFTETTKRDEHGRFSVRIPLKESADSLGDSYTMAEKRFLALERKLDRSPQYKQLYCDFMREYEALGHMSQVPENIIDFSKPYYVLPHHGVYRESSLTTKLRVVFDASASLDSLRYENTKQWWCGTTFLRKPSVQWLNRVEPTMSTDLPELKTHTVNLVSIQSNRLFDFERLSSFIRLQRACAYLLRFIDNARAQVSAHCSGRECRTGLLSVNELEHSLSVMTRSVQQESFPSEYHVLNNNLQFNSNHKFVNTIAGLNIFLDEHKIIRVGGRLCNATDFSFEKKHPVLLCGKHRFTRLLCEHEHKRLLHAGPQLLVYSMRERWWVLGARNLARQVVHNCVTCTRMKGKTLNPIMGNLPAERLEPSFPFMRCGVDYAGPMLILNRKGRGARLIKAYICLFVCFTTRAVHLELVGSLTTQDYLLALKRFISRRGKPYQIFSDNGKNFVGAEKELSSIFDNPNDISDFVNNNQIRLTYIPPYSPHFGGLWEAGVKSCKYHLRRVLGNARLTYEEFGTVLTQIEAVLNSRPLSPLSSDANDFLPLTPAHFMIGRPLTAPACGNLTSNTPSRLCRYDRVEQLRQHFWQRWSKEYVSELQQRTKWKINSENLVPDSLVLIKEENLPPFKWRMGRIVCLFPGKDDISRVAEIRTATGTIRRAFSKICPLLAEPSNQ